jgi:hypothetical protein
MPISRTSGQGRRKGIPNKATAEIKELAQRWGPAAIAKLAMMAGLNGAGIAKQEATRVAAIKELLDRGYGKARQPITGGDDDDPPVTISFRWADAVVPVDGPSLGDITTVLSEAVAKTTDR